MTNGSQRPTIRHVGWLKALRQSWGSTADPQKQGWRRFLPTGVNTAVGLGVSMWLTGMDALLSAVGGGIGALTWPTFLVGRRALRTVRGATAVREQMLTDQAEWHIKQRLTAINTAHNAQVAELHRLIDEREGTLTEFRERDSAHAYETKYGVSAFQFSALSETDGEIVRRGLESLREPMALVCDRAEELLQGYSRRARDTIIDGRPWGEWVAPKLEQELSWLRAARERFRLTLDAGDDARLAFRTVWLCYVRARDLINRLGALIEHVLHAPSYEYMQREDRRLKNEAAQVMAVSEFKELTDSLRPYQPVRS